MVDHVVDYKADQEVDSEVDSEADMDPGVDSEARIAIHTTMTVIHSTRII